MSKKVASIFDKNDNDDEHQDQPHGQAFFAGGSETSGLEILGPARDSDLIANVLNDARQHAELNATPSEQTLPVTFWRNGFTVGEDSELRDYASNREFLTSLRRGEVPAELSARVRGGMIDVKLQNRSFQDYEPGQKKTPAFTGEGYRLGAPAPAVAKDNNEEQQQQSTSSGAGTSQPSLDEIRRARLARFASKPKKEDQ